MKGKMPIAGSWEFGKGTQFIVENPATGAAIARVASASPEQLDRAMNGARQAFARWSKTSPFQRAAMLQKLGGVVRDNADKIAKIMTEEQGKPLNEARGEILKLAGAFAFYAEEATRVHGEIIPNEAASHNSYVVREPIGVVAAITPWNYPAELIGWKLAAALAAGCTIVIKPPELTPFTALEIARCCDDAGIPPGVVNILLGKGSEIGQSMIEHHEPDKIAFTGSSAVGLRILQSLKSVKRVSLELGGNCPMIVTATADLKAAVQGAVRRSFRNMGQICIAINRIYVDTRVVNEFTDLLSDAAEKLTLGNGLTTPDADLGAMASSEPLDKTTEHQADALMRGARLVAGGAPPVGDAYTNGYFYRPTVLADCTHDMKIMTEETFGPIVGIGAFDTLTEAVERANDTPYGLASDVYSKSLDEIDYLSCALDYGNVAVNNVDAGIMNAPYGGRKQSGIGYEHGREGLLEYFNFKHIRIKYDRPEGMQ